MIRDANRAPRVRYSLPVTYAFMQDGGSRLDQIPVYHACLGYSLFPKWNHRSAMTSCPPPYARLSTRSDMSRPECCTA
eukprot:4343801-Pleurochrysis_carterae.AAC.10